LVLLDVSSAVVATHGQSAVRVPTVSLVDARFTRKDIEKRIEAQEARRAALSPAERAAEDAKLKEWNHEFREWCGKRAATVADLNPEATYLIDSLRRNAKGPKRETPS
jgi:predicted  nucleic acid-binding Zn-ribbon protein